MAGLALSTIQGQLPPRQLPFGQSPPVQSQLGQLPPPRHNYPLDIHLTASFIDETRSAQHAVHNFNESIKDHIRIMSKDIIYSYTNSVNKKDFV